MAIIASLFVKEEHCEVTALDRGRKAWTSGRAALLVYVPLHTGHPILKDWPRKDRLAPTDISLVYAQTQGVGRIPVCEAGRHAFPKWINLAVRVGTYRVTQIFQH